MKDLHRVEGHYCEIEETLADLKKQKARVTQKMRQTITERTRQDFRERSFTYDPKTKKFTSGIAVCQLTSTINPALIDSKQGTLKPKATFHTHPPFSKTCGFSLPDILLTFNENLEEATLGCSGVKGRERREIITMRPRKKFVGRVIDPLSEAILQFNNKQLKKEFANLPRGIENELALMTVRIDEYKVRRRRSKTKPLIPLPSEENKTTKRLLI